MTGRRALRLLLPLFAAVLAVIATSAPRFTWSNDGVRIDHPWTHPAAALGAALALAGTAALARRAALAVVWALLAAGLAVLAVHTLRYRIEAAADAVELRSLAGSQRVPWTELDAVEPASAMLTLRVRDGRSLRIGTTLFAPDDRIRLERTIARRVREASR